MDQRVQSIEANLTQLSAQISQLESTGHALEHVRQHALYKNMSGHTDVGTYTSHACTHAQCQPRTNDQGNYV